MNGHDDKNKRKKKIKCKSDNVEAFPPTSAPLTFFVGPVEAAKEAQEAEEAL